MQLIKSVEEDAGAEKLVLADEYRDYELMLSWLDLAIRTMKRRQRRRLGNLADVVLEIYNKQSKTNEWGSGSLGITGEAAGLAVKAIQHAAALPLAEEPLAAGRHVIEAAKYVLDTPIAANSVDAVHSSIEIRMVEGRLAVVHIINEEPSKA